MSDHEDIMQQWDSWRKYIAEGGTASWPRDEFEMVIANYKERVKELDTNYLSAIKLAETYKEGWEEAESRLKRLQGALKEVVNFIPDGWEMPLGYNQIVNQAKKLLREVEG